MSEHSIDGVVVQFRTLFVGRSDAYLQEPGAAVKSELTDAILVEHLSGRRRIGAYSLLPRDGGALAKFMTVDIDGKNLPGRREEALRQACAASSVLDEIGIENYIEESRSGIGFHLWVFFGTNEVPLDEAQRLGRGVVHRAGLPPDTEVFPKGDAGTPFGCTPYLPLHGVLGGVPTGRFVGSDGSVDADQIAVLFDISCTTRVQVVDALQRLGGEGAVVPAFKSAPQLDTATILAGLPQGKRDIGLFKLACRLRAAEVPEDVAERLVVEAAGQCAPPFSAETAREKVHRAYQKYADPSAWEAPAAFHARNLPAFPIASLPDWMREFAEALATSTQTPVDLAGTLVLATAAACVAGKYKVVVGPDWQEPLSLYTVVVLPPGTRKSAVFSHVTAPLEEREKELVRAAEPEIARATAAYQVLEKRLKRAQDMAAKTDGPKRETLLGQVEDLANELSRTRVPATPRLIIDDCTPERVATILRDQEGRLAIMSPEGDVFEVMAGRYGSGSGPNLGVYLKGHAGDALRVDRVGRPSEFIPRPALTIGLTVQPEVLQGLSSRPGFRGRGLLGRFLYALPPNPLGHRAVEAAPVSAQVKNSYRWNVIRLLNMGARFDPAEEKQPQEVHFALPARVVLLNFAQDLEPRLGAGGDLSALTDWAGKLVGAIARIAGILHLADAGEGDPIEVETVENAITLGRYYLDHARGAFADMGADPEVERARYVLAWIERSGTDRFTKRDAFEATKGRFKQVSDLEPALDILVDHGYIREEQGADRSGPGRRPSPTYEVNPAAWGSSK